MKSVSVPYTLSKDTYPDITIGVHGTTVDNGCHGIHIYTPQSINIELDQQGTVVDIEELVSAYNQLQEVIEGPK